MLFYLVLIIFIICVGITAGGIALSVRLQKRLDHAVSSPILYYKVFISAFGFYGIWGQILMQSLLSPYITDDILAKICNVALLLGLPFVIFAWMTLLQFSAKVAGKSYKEWLIFCFLAVNLIIASLIGYLSDKLTSVQSLDIIKYYYIAAGFIYMLVATGVLLFSTNKQFGISLKDKRLIAIGLAIIFIIQTTFLLTFSYHYLLGLMFILTFFVGNLFLPIYFTYYIRPKIVKLPEVQNFTFEGFCKNYEISTRESEIISEICNGLSNKEIADKLFITLQTVKDHTHRIYIKTDVKSRVQLMNLVKDFK
jgi:DNA-binding CsgD family transcriptional regulator